MNRNKDSRWSSEKRKPKVQGRMNESMNRQELFCTIITDREVDL